MKSLSVLFGLMVAILGNQWEAHAQGAVGGGWTQPTKCNQRPYKPGDPNPNPMDPNQAACYLFCEGPNGEQLCEYGYNDCKEDCKKQSCNPCADMTHQYLEDILLADAVEKRDCNTIPQLCCKQIPVNGGSLEWSCWMEPEGGCDKVDTNKRPYCWQMPTTD